MHDTVREIFDDSVGVLGVELCEWDPRRGCCAKQRKSKDYNAVLHRASWRSCAILFTARKKYKT